MRLKVLNTEVSAEYEVKEITYNGSDHIVVPVVMLVEGVHHGTGGPMLYTNEEIKKNPEAWNGMPVVVNHPKHGDDYVSANTPDVLESEYVGQIFNARFEDNKLKADIYINVALLQDKSGEALERIRNKQAMEISVGVLTNAIEKEGEWNNEYYNQVATDLTPDHLALLPDTEGACSNDDGCGIRANENKSKSNVKLKTNKNDEMDKNEKLAKKAMKSLENVYIEPSLVTNAGEYLQTTRMIQQMLDAEDSENSYHYLEALYSDYFIYRKTTRRANQPVQTKYFRQPYSVNDKNEVTFNGDPQEVRKETNYTNLESKSKTKMKRTDIENENKKVEMKKCEKVSALIQNENTKWEEADKEFLEGLEDSQLDKMMPEEEATGEDSGKSKKPAANTSKEAKKEEGKEVTANAGAFDPQEEIKKFFANAKSAEDAIGIFPDELQSQLKAGLKLQANQRKQLIKGIVDNSKFTEEKLKNKDLEELQDMYEAIVPDEDDVADYSLSAYTSNEFDQELPPEQDPAIVAMTAPFTAEEQQEKKKEQTGS